MSPLPPEEEIERLAKLAHETNRGYCIGLGDHSQVPWEQAPEWHKESVRSGVRHALNFPECTAEDSHKCFLAEKEADGWRFGEVKDPVAKTHPCFVPYNQLPESQRRKNAIFLAVVRGK